MAIHSVKSPFYITKWPSAQLNGLNSIITLCNFIKTHENTYFHEHVYLIEYPKPKKYYKFSYKFAYLLFDFWISD